jgi:hypothetical protein
MQEKSWTETIKVAGEKVGEKIEALLREGNIRRVVVKQEGRIIAEFPLTIGVVGAAIAPPVAAIAAIAAIVTECSVEVERIEPQSPPESIEAPTERTVAAIQSDETVDPTSEEQKAGSPETVLIR